MIFPEAARRCVLAGISLFAVAASVGCAAREPVSVAPPTAESQEELRKFGEVDYFDPAPEAIKTMAAQYPAAARRAGVEGTVMIQALVGKDGLVKDTRVFKSIPTLDAAAAAAVRQWVFKPVRAVVWVLVPVKFSLH